MGPRSSGVGFFCFHALGDTKQKKPTPLNRGPPLHVNRVLISKTSKSHANARCDNKGTIVKGPIFYVQFLRLKPLLSSLVWFSATVLGEVLCNALTSWRDVTVSTILLLLSQLLQHIKLLSPDKMTSFAVKLKGTPLLKGFQ